MKNNILPILILYLGPLLWRIFVKVEKSNPKELDFKNRIKAKVSLAINLIYPYNTLCHLSSASKPLTHSISECDGSLQLCFKGWYFIHAPFSESIASFLAYKLSSKTGTNFILWRLLRRTIVFSQEELLTKFLCSGYRQQLRNSETKCLRMPYSSPVVLILFKGEDFALTSLFIHFFLHSSLRQTCLAF